MEQFKLSYENSGLVVQCQEVLQQVIKLCTSRNRVFLLGSDRDLFFGDLDPLILESPVVDLTFVRHGVIDIDCDTDMVYSVDETGRVWQTKVHQSSGLDCQDNWKELVVLNDRTCPHGQRNTTERVPISRVTCNNDGVLFTTHFRELYGMGEFNEILTSDNPQRIECFRGLKVMQVAAGNNFVVVLTQKKRNPQQQQQQQQPPVNGNFPSTSNNLNQNTYEDGLSVGSDTSDVFVNADCLKCVPEMDLKYLNPLNYPDYTSLHHHHNHNHQHQSSGSGSHNILHHGLVHLHHGSNISKSTTETSIASSPCPSDNTFEEDLPNKAVDKSTPLKTHKDSALNFFLDLSHSGEEYIGQTKLLTENVTKNITTMLSEGVKTLSRHMSGSDNTESTAVNTEADGTPSPETQQAKEQLEKEDLFEELEKDNKPQLDEIVDKTRLCNGTATTTTVERESRETSLVKQFLEKQLGEDSMDPSEASNSFQELGSATDLHSEFCGTENRIAKMCRLGSNLLDTDVWCFGSVNRGHLCTGDHIKRTRINSVLALSGQGVKKIACGKEHSAALTLDGRLFLWGSNGRNQISAEMVDNFSAPREIRSVEPILDVTCGHGQTVMLTNDLRVAEQRHGQDCNALEADKERKKLPPLAVMTEESLVAVDGRCGLMDFQHVPSLLASDSFTVQNHGRFLGMVSKHLTSEQLFLQEALTSYQLIRPAMKKLGGGVRNSPALDKLCQQYQLLLQVTAMNVRTLVEFYCRRISCSELSVLQNCTEMIAVYRTYTRRFCDVLCVRGFKPMMGGGGGYDYHKIFHKPLNRVWAYMTLVYDLMELDAAAIVENGRDGTTMLEKRLAWEKFCNEKDLMLDEAVTTLAFWDKYPKLQVTQMLQIPERRMILDSKQISLKAQKGHPWLVLFSDVLCNMQNSGTVIPLETLWTSPITDTEQQKNAFKMVTPLETTILVAQSHEEKMRWLDALEQCIRVALKRPSRTQTKVPLFRNASFVFPGDHQKYGGVKYFGRWHLGNMHGIGHLVFPDGRVYNGQVSGNEINGFGRMYTPRVGIYEGDFERGKYHGYGVLELQNKTMYEGNFRNGMYNGHGTLMSDDGTYIGEFVDNQKHGYGVLDENFSGNKYMGQFVENRKHGRGICITMDGDYFEGQFSQDQLNGRGVASFEAQGHGSYYEGEMTIHGPSGKGVMYMTSIPVDAVASGEEWREGRPPTTVNGIVMKGTLSGSWQDVQIVHGNLQMGQKFSKFSSLFGKVIVDCSEKWLALFNDWQLQVFGVNLLGGGMTRSGLMLDTELDAKMVWGKIAVFTNNAKSKEKLKSDEFLAKNFNSVTFLNGSGNGGAGMSGSSKKGGRMSNATSWDNLSVKSQQIQNMSASVAGLGTSLKAINLKSVSRLSLDEKKTMVMPESVGERSEADELEMTQKLEKFESLLHEVGEDRDEDQAERRAETLSRDRFGRSMKKSQHLDFVPSFGMAKVETRDEVLAIRAYLAEAFKDPNHPLGVLASKISHCFYSAYGCWKIKPTPILSSHAMKEWESITQRVYAIIRRMFPGLPQDTEIIEGESVSFRFLLYPILLSEGIYSLLFVLYASKCSQRDELYRQRLIVCEKKTDQELASFLKIEDKFFPIIKSEKIEEAIDCLKQLKDKYSPLEMLGLIQQMFKAIDEAKREAMGEECPLNSDDIIPISIFMVIRANVQHLGAEISLMEDLMGNDFDPIIRGYVGYCFTTLEASYQYILSDKFFG